MSSDTNRILLAEDHVVSRHLMKQNLTTWGFEVVTAQDGEEAAQILESGAAPTLALIDWMMPKLDGLEVCKRIRIPSDRPYVYLILLTSKSSRDEIAKGFESGADDYVVKPFDHDEFRARLVIGRRVVRLHRQLANQVRDLEKAVGEARKLKGLLPICMFCKSIRDAEGAWRQIEAYIHGETGAEFSHGICPGCMETNHPAPQTRRNRL